MQYNDVHLFIFTLIIREQNDESDHEEVELLLEAYAADLNQISAEVSRMKAALDDTDDFVDTHLSTMRNKIIRLSLFMDMGMFSLGFAALAAGNFNQIHLKCSTHLDPYFCRGLQKFFFEKLMSIVFD